MVNNNIKFLVSGVAHYNSFSEKWKLLTAASFQLFRDGEALWKKTVHTNGATPNAG